jgi:hypothetical protein
MGKPSLPQTLDLEVSVSGADEPDDVALFGKNESIVEDNIEAVVSP